MPPAGCMEFLFGVVHPTSRIWAQVWRYVFAHGRIASVAYLAVLSLGDWSQSANNVGNVACDASRQLILLAVAHLWSELLKLVFQLSDQLMHAPGDSSSSTPQ